MINYFLHPNEFKLESGKSLDQIKIAYTVYGNPKAEETVWVCHALSGSSLVEDWWGGIFGVSKLFDFDKYRIVCANVLGSCYGSTGPDDDSKGLDFPLITIRDIVAAHELLREHLEIQKIDILIGASLGGQQALEWAVSSFSQIKKLILVATNAVHSPFGRAFNEAQRLALKSDGTLGQVGGGLEGLKAARALAMLSYRSYEDFDLKQADVESSIDNYNGSSYVRYQGQKFTGRFKPLAYYSLTQSMDSHDVGRARGTVESALQSVLARTLVVGINSDLLFPFCEQQFLADKIPNAELGVIDSVHGHDAFLIEYKQLEKLISDFLFNDFKNYKPTIFKTTNNE